MADDSWYYSREGKRLGPFALPQLAQMVAAGMIGRADLVMHVDDGKWIEAGGVPELFPPATSTASNPAALTGALLVACDRCQARISDVAEHCPQCGHPQVPFEAKEAGCELHPCNVCGTRNWVRNALYFFTDRACRGCGRPCTAVHPDQVRDCDVDQLYWSYANFRRSFHGFIIGGGAALGAVVVGLLGGLLGPIWTFAGFAVGGWLGAVLSEPGFEALYCRLYVHGHPLPAPNDGSPVTERDWRLAEHRAAREQARREPKAASAVSLPWRWIVGAVVAVGLIALWLRSDQAKTEKQHVDQEKVVGAAMTRSITANKDEGVFSHDVVRTNGSAVVYGQCDLTLTVYLTSGKRPPVSQYWASWAAKEQKKVNIPAGGTIERVDVAGTMVNTATGEKGRVEATFEWKPKPALAAGS